MRLWRGRTAARPAEVEPSEQERQITHGVASLREATVREVMTPRVDVDAIEAPVRVIDVVQAVRRSGYSHFPVYRGDLDRLLGVLFVKDLFHAEEFSEKGANGGSGALSADLDVTDRLREPYVVPESRPAIEVLADMRRRRRGFAVVVDEHGGFAGVLTINDLVSELVGDLRDEFDRSNEPTALRIDASRFLIDGACGVSELRSELGMEIPDGEYVTFGGFLLDLLGHVPVEGEVAAYEDWTFKITRMDRRRIAKVVAEVHASKISSSPGN